MRALTCRHEELVHELSNALAPGLFQTLYAVQEKLYYQNSLEGSYAVPSPPPPQPPQIDFYSGYSDIIIGKSNGEHNEIILRSVVLERRHGKEKGLTA
ncbi:unnamed protein product [Dovyalis caffra]|uniref:Uncharacterized protein n=1 Tax=Dovyalis caffra TaxID=77055 RepID=A0AAV1R0U7_9ROSI|nr:unnamed protein product [Dovyalis caffra]